MIQFMCRKIESFIGIIYVYSKLLYYKIKYGKKVKFGKKIRFRKGFRLYIDKNGKVEIGNYVFFNKNCTVDSFYKITINDNNLFGENVKIYDHNHVFYDKNLRRGNHFFGQPINIGKNNWFGTNSVILSGSTIGENNVIGAGIIINKNIELKNDSIIKNKNNEYQIEKIKYKN